MEFKEIERKNLNFYAPRFEIRIDGADILYEGVEIVSVTITNVLEGPDSFDISINNPELKWLEDPLFQLGKEVEIKMGYGSNVSPLIVGEITAIEPSFSSTGPKQMGIRGYDLLKRLQRGDKIRSWEYLPDFVIAGIIAVEHGLRPDGIQPTFTIHPKVVQNEETDYNFLKKRAQFNGYEVFVDLRKLCFRKPKIIKDSVTTLTLGKSLNSFTPEINVANKPSQVTVRGWDPRLKKEIIGLADKGQELTLELNKESASQIIQKLYGKVERTIREPVFSQDEAEKRARSILEGSSDQFIKGDGECIGIPELRAGKYVDIDGLGKRFSMKYYIEKTTHKIDTSGYKTTFSVKGNAL